MAGHNLGNMPPWHLYHTAFHIWAGLGLGTVRREGLLTFSIRPVKERVWDWRFGTSWWEGNGLGCKYSPGCVVRGYTFRPAFFIGTQAPPGVVLKGNF